MPTIVPFELVKWAVRESGADRTEEIAAFTAVRTVVPLGTGIARPAAELSARHRLSTADAIIYASALACDADLPTCDRHFENLPSVRYLLKPAA